MRRSTNPIYFIAFILVAAVRRGNVAPYSDAYDRVLKEAGF